MMSTEKNLLWDRERDAMGEAWYLPEGPQYPVAVVGSTYTLLWINRGHYTEGLKVGDFLYTEQTKRTPLSMQAIWNENPRQDFKEGVRWAEKQHGIID